jgi:hypothetical protein
MQHYKELELESSQEVDWYPEEDHICDLQCGDSLAIAASGRGKEVLGVKKRLLRSLIGLRRDQRS